MPIDTTSPSIETVSDLLKGAGELPVLPEVAVRIFEEMRSPQVTAARMADFVKKDPVLTSAVLRIANSALYGGRAAISDLAFAIARVGLYQIRNLLLAMVLRSKMADPRVYGDSGIELMDHGLAVAFGAGLVSDAAGMDGSDAFLCGLLHDFGKLALLKCLREQNDGEDLGRDQREMVTEWHGEAGGLLIDQWDLPDNVVAVARHHHQPDQAQDRDRPMVAVVALANAVAHNLALGEDSPSSINLIEHPSNLILGLNEEQITEIKDDLPGLFQTARSALFS